MILVVDAETMKQRRPAFYGLFLISLLLLAGCSRSDKPALLEISGETMGTWYSVKVVDVPKGVSQKTVSQTVQSELDNVNRKMSTYLPDSEVSRINQAEVSAMTPVSRDTFEVLSKSLEIWRLSLAAFDITIGPLVNLWGFGPEQREPGTVPSGKAMTTAWNRVGSDGLILHMDGRKVEKRKDLYLDLSAIAKGYAVDKVALALEGMGISRYLVEVGGEIRAGNSKGPNRPWKVAIEEPISEARKVHRVVSITNAAMATSGDYRNYFEVDGKQYSHTIDPRDGQPVKHNLVSVTVIAPRCEDADAWATAIMVLGPKQGMEVAEANNMSVYMILKTDKGFDTKYSQSFAGYLSQSKE